MVDKSFLLITTIGSHYYHALSNGENISFFNADGMKIEIFLLIGQLTHSDFFVVTDFVWGKSYSKN